MACRHKQMAVVVKTVLGSIPFWLGFGGWSESDVHRGVPGWDFVPWPYDLNPPHRCFSLFYWGLGVFDPAAEESDSSMMSKPRSRALGAARQEERLGIRCSQLNGNAQHLDKQMHEAGRSQGISCFFFWGGTPQNGFGFLSGFPLKPYKLPWVCMSATAILHFFKAHTSTKKKKHKKTTKNTAQRRKAHTGEPPAFASSFFPGPGTGFPVPAAHQAIWRFHGAMFFSPMAGAVGQEPAGRGAEGLQGADQVPPGRRSLFFSSSFASLAFRRKCSVAGGTLFSSFLWASRLEELFFCSAPGWH